MPTDTPTPPDLEIARLNLLAATAALIRTARSADGVARATLQKAIAHCGTALLHVYPTPVAEAAQHHAKRTLEIVQDEDAMLTLSGPGLEDYVDMLCRDLFGHVEA